MSTIKDISIANLFNLEGKIAIVTGGTGGIGFVLSLALAEAGADIVSIQIPNDPGARELQEKVEKFGRKFQAFDSNLKDYKNIGTTFANIWKAGVIPDILLNCAGITWHSKVEETPLKSLDDVCLFHAL